ncbi:TIM barrel protein [Fuerstiella marisgermanici]|uniref:Xylose isomerase-like TIM barrel n=1 Tax=Fuerstiella marisgermanici TaxID=1891926 RepID=A0A1P8WAS9_9PLAN|nr:TIM barrel protein [Fuerstiella marisgermanici]APZ91168.1 Xylose isomerase-like TIM barrel [Fuerstiella marisgermanici]
MDVVLEEKHSHAGLSNENEPPLLGTAELLLATDFSELVAEVRQLQRRRIRMVSIRRQRACRIGLPNLKMVLEDAGLQICTVGFAGGFTGTLGRGYRQAVDDTRRALDFAAALNARGVVVMSGSRGNHTYNHAARTIRDGLFDCLDDALRLRIDMLVPLTTMFGKQTDVFEPRCDSMLDWIDEFDNHRIKGMMMLRRRSPLKGLPACWERCLRSGGALRIGRRCRRTLGSHNVVAEIALRLRDVAVPVS